MTRTAHYLVHAPIQSYSTTNTGVMRTALCGYVETMGTGEQHKHWGVAITVGAFHADTYYAICSECALLALEHAHGDTE